MFDGIASLDAYAPLAFFNNLHPEHDIEISVIYDTMKPVEGEPSASDRVNGNLASKTGELSMSSYSMDTAPPLDVPLVPGGAGTREILVSLNHTR